MSADHNQYRPPMTAVADPPEVPRKRPVAVTIALVFMSVSVLLALAGIFSLFKWVERGELAPVAMVWPMAEQSLLVAAIVAVARGRHWGRVVFALLTAFALAGVLQRWASMPSGIAFEADPL